jgi:hypothetical protein
MGMQILLDQSETFPKGFDDQISNLVAKENQLNILICY